MRKRGKTQNDVLTYDPTNKRQKRRAAGCVTGFCNYTTTGMSCDEVGTLNLCFAPHLSLQLSDSVRLAGIFLLTSPSFILQYPFASTAEGGAGAQIGCVPGYQNTDQGSYLSSFNAIEGITPGKKFGVEVSGADCSSFSRVGPLPRAGKRATSAGRNVNGSGYNGKHRPFVRITRVVHN